MNDIALEIIHQYIADMKVPVHTLRKAHFKQEAYALWAAYEILRRVARNPNRRPIEVIDEFRMEMDDLSVENRHTSWIFSVAYDVAEDILCKFV